MNIKKLFLDILNLDKTSLSFRAKLIRRKYNRFIYWITKINRTHKFDYRNIPVIINNRNRLSFLILLLSWLERAGMKNVYIIDNNSDYPPLLEFYGNNKYKVIFNDSNIGYRALWIIDDLKHLLKDYYIYSDPDVVPVDECPLDIVNFMYQSLKNNFQIDKIGIGLKIDDLPDHYSLKSEVVNWETQFWKIQVKPFLYKAQVDTTFALYSPFAEGGGECKSYRTGPPYVARHLPWYENTAAPDSEQEYYKKNSEAFSTHWTMKK